MPHIYHPIHKISYNLIRITLICMGFEIDETVWCDYPLANGNGNNATEENTFSIINLKDVNGDVHVRVHLHSRCSTSFVVCGHCWYLLFYLLTRCPFTIYCVESMGRNTSKGLTLGLIADGYNFLSLIFERLNEPSLPKGKKGWCVTRNLIVTFLFNAKYTLIIRIGWVAETRFMSLLLQF